MATAETMPLPEEGHSRRRPFKKFMKRLAKIKTSSSPSASSENNSASLSLRAVKKSHTHSGNTPDRLGDSSQATPGTQHRSPSLAAESTNSIDALSKTQSQISLPTSTDEQSGLRTAGGRSIAPTIATQPGTTHSDTGRSKSGTFTSTSAIGGPHSMHEAGGEGSTFSSPAPSFRSLTTTLTTIQSTAPGAMLNNASAANGQGGAHSATSTHFSHQFPTLSTPVSAIPPHMAGAGVPHTGSGGHPHTYNTATANGMLTDDASIMTLASSTKRRRRNSLDTNASVKALAPSSVFGGSRESLPLSVLSANVSSQEQRDTQAMGVIRPNLAGTAAAERASVYSSSGVLKDGEGRETRSSYYATRREREDGASVRSGLLGHGRSESITGSIGGQASPLASPIVLSEER